MSILQRLLCLETGDNTHIRKSHLGHCRRHSRRRHPRSRRCRHRCHRCRHQHHNRHHKYLAHPAGCHCSRNLLLGCQHIRTHRPIPGHCRRHSRRRHPRSRRRRHRCHRCQNQHHNRHHKHLAHPAGCHCSRNLLLECQHIRTRKWRQVHCRYCTRRRHPRSRRCRHRCHRCQHQHHNRHHKHLAHPARCHCSRNPPKEYLHNRTRKLIQGHCRCRTRRRHRHSRRHHHKYHRRRHQHHNRHHKPLAHPAGCHCSRNLLLGC